MVHKECTTIQSNKTVLFQYSASSRYERQHTLLTLGTDTLKTVKTKPFVACSEHTFQNTKIKVYYDSYSKKDDFMVGWKYVGSDIVFQENYYKGIVDESLEPVRSLYHEIMPQYIILGIDYYKFNYQFSYVYKHPTVKKTFSRAQFN